MKTTIGVLALQGDFAEHITALETCGVQSREVRTAKDLDGLKGLIIPGGETTTIQYLLERYGMREKLAKSKMPVWGTCAGAILMAKRTSSEVENLGLIDMQVERNAYGRQLQSFEVNMQAPGLGKIKGIFIRAPQIHETGEGVEILASYENKPILVRQGRYLASTFHPELTQDFNLHKYFVALCN